MAEQPKDQKVQARRPKRPHHELSVLVLLVEELEVMAKSKRLSVALRAPMLPNRAAQRPGAQPAGPDERPP